VLTTADIRLNRMANELKRVDSYQYPSAHLAHLTDGQQEALDRFKSLCQEKGYYHPAVDESNIYASHDDETLLYVLPIRTPNCMVQDGR